MIRQTKPLVNMRLLSVFYIFLGLYCCHSATVFVGKDEAHGVLFRTKRANSGWFEELKMGNLERECLEEKCSYEEAREVFEHTEATNEFWKIYNVKDHCESNPCENNGLCTTQNAESYMCLCVPGFSGRNCEQAIKDIPDSCLHDNGQCEHFCMEEDGQRNCSCPDGYFLGSNGQNCLTLEAFPCGKVPLLQGGGAATNPQVDVRSRIVGGAECPKGHCPWQVLLKYGQKGFCGGVIYKPTWILTAAHCLEKLNVKFLKIVAGEHDIEVDEGTEQVIQVEQMLMHPGYVSETSDNDIALLYLRKPIIYSAYAVPVCLPLRDMAERELWAVSKHTVSGWGKRSEDGPTSRLLRRLQVPRIRTQECIESSNVTLTNNMFCAGYIEGKQDSCKGDSGGPLVTRYRDTTFLLGIVSWGKGCARPGSYGIYTRVSNYLQWIHELTANSTAATQ
ncbi:coagulation factor VII [Sinocyclocheilus anshuiensis]|uniref:Coagulation factor VII-like n=1 Tax=Sinocyclocheilus anshuiensis TaxID=1608454 RepID=A0A671KLU1_9TELE|nr:PREDICTED: coagulation factor VII-like [Sinocyclocheilus anshuiensis]